MLSGQETESQLSLAEQELAVKLCEPIKYYVEVEKCGPASDYEVLNWLVYKNNGQPYDCGSFQIDLNIDIARAAIKEAYYSNKIKVERSEENGEERVTVFPTYHEFGPILLLPII